MKAELIEIINHVVEFNLRPRLPSLRVRLILPGLKSPPSDHIVGLLGMVSPPESNFSRSSCVVWGSHHEWQNSQCLGNAKDQEVPSQQPRMEATQFIYYTMGRTHIKNLILRSGDGLYQELESNHMFLIKVVYAPDWIHFPKGQTCSRGKKWVSWRYQASIHPSKCPREQTNHLTDL